MSGLEWSHGRRRPKSPRVLGKDAPVKALPPAESAETAPTNDPKTGRFLPGNRAHRRRQVKEKARGISTLNPERCQSWLSPHVRDGAVYGIELLRRFPDPALARLAGDVADAHTVYRALLALGAQGDVEALREARAWLREHRSALATLSGLASESGAVADDDRFYVEEGGKKR